MNTKKPLTKCHIPPIKEHTIIHRLNVISEGINYIIPQFWLQELIEMNRFTQSVDELKFPPFETYANFLRLYGLQNPSKSKSQMQQLHLSDSASFRSELLDESNFVSSKTLFFSKMNDPISCSDIQWKVFNPFLWNLMQAKLSLESQGYEINSSNKGKQCYFEKVPKVAFFLRKDFILQKGQSKAKLIKTQVSQQESLQVYFKNNKYTIATKQVNQQIANELRNMTQQQINLMIIVDQPLESKKLFRKLQVQGFFSQNLPVKELLRSLVEVDTMKKSEYLEKFYFYDQFGQKMAQKLTTLKHLSQLLQGKQLIISTSPLNEIIDSQVSVKNGLRQLLQKQFKFAEAFDIIKGQQGSQDGKEDERMMSMKRLIVKVSVQNNYKKAKQQIKKISQYQGPLKTTQIRAGFKPYTRQSSQQLTPQLSTIISSSNNPHLQGSKNTLISAQQQGHMDSLTTNMDTPMQEQGQMREESYQNKRLQKHSSYNRFERKRKALSFMQKRKRNNVIIKDNSANNAPKVGNQLGEYKRRVRFALFTSLDRLEGDSETLEFLVENMRKVALDTIYSTDNKFIQHPYPKLLQLIDDNQPSFYQTPLPNYTTKQTQRQQKHQSIQLQHHYTQLQKISQQIQRIYQPIKFSELQKFPSQSLQKMQLLSDYQNALSFKKDNQQIKTIVDNSEGPYSEMEKHTIKVNCRRTEKKTRQINNYVNDHISCMSDDGGDHGEDGDETI